MEMKAELIAPCGMNCRLCYAYQRDKAPCPGCRGDDKYKPAHCAKCAIKNCENLKQTEGGLCYECDAVPCRRLRALNGRYETKYHMSLLTNLAYIRQYGMEEFLQQEEEHWACRHCGTIISVHANLCPGCNQPVY